MKKLIKIFLVAFLSLSSFQASFSQGFKDRFFTSLGYTAFLDYARLPTSNHLNYTSGSSYADQTANYTASSPSSISYFTYGAKFRFNIVDFTDDASLAVHVHPALGLSFSFSNVNDESNIGSLSIPIMISYNTGNVSTYKTSKNNGFGIGVGVEYYNGGLIKTGTDISGLYYYDASNNYVEYTNEVERKNSAWLVPAVELAYRYWSKSNKAKELSLLVSFGGKGSLETDTEAFQSVIQEGSAKSPMHIRLMWSTYLNY